MEISGVTSGAVVDDSFGTSIPGIYACGNVLHVHDLVDHVSEESYKAGTSAAAFVRNERRDTQTVTVLDGEGVRGVVPQKIRLNSPNAVSLMFRPSAVFRNSTIVVSSGTRDLCRKKALIYTLSVGQRQHLPPGSCICPPGMHAAAKNDYCSHSCKRK